MDNKKIEFGQTFTDEHVAKLMVELIAKNIGPKSKILDPCIGKNVFFSKVKNKLQYKELVGIEIDKSLMTKEITNFYNNKTRRLLQSNFFDFQEGGFETIIMNPPYVRQELLNSKINSKEKIARAIPNEYDLMPKKSNLYVYFILKALRHLKTRGKLVAIIYDSWLFTDFGTALKKYIFENYNLKKIIHFRHGAFEKINVGATIILIEKNSQKEKIEYLCLKSPKDLKSIKSKKFEILTPKELLKFEKRHGNHINFNLPIFTPIRVISSEPIKRGMSAKVNKYFIFNKNKYPRHTKRILKNVTKIKSFSGSTGFDYILQIDKKIDSEVKTYLELIKNKIQSSENNKSIKSEIDKNNAWYTIPAKPPGNIIFNYYIRNNIHFILNPKNYLVADNFYNLYVQKNIIANLAILNSTLTKYALLKYSKSQGHGLFKIQLNRFRELPIVDIQKLSKNSIKQLNKIGLELIQSKRKNSDKLIDKIDKILIKEVNHNSKEIICLQDLKLFIEEIKSVS